MQEDVSCVTKNVVQASLLEMVSGSSLEMSLHLISSLIKMLQN